MFATMKCAMDRREWSVFGKVVHDWDFEKRSQGFLDNWRFDFFLFLALDSMHYINTCTNLTSECAGSLAVEVSSKAHQPEKTTKTTPYSQ